LLSLISLIFLKRFCSPRTKMVQKIQERLQ